MLLLSPVPDAGLLSHTSEVMLVTTLPLVDPLEAVQHVTISSATCVWLLGTHAGVRCSALLHVTAHLALHVSLDKAVLTVTLMVAVQAAVVDVYVSLLQIYRNPKRHGKC